MKSAPFPPAPLLLVLAALTLAGCGSVGIVGKTRPVTYGDLPPGPLNSRSFSESTRHLLSERGLSRSTKRDPKGTITELADGLRDDDSPTVHLALAEVCLERARRLALTQPDRALGHYLCAAEHAFYGLNTSPVEPEEEKILTATYNHCTGKVAALLHSRSHDWTRPASLTGPTRSYDLTTRLAGNAIVNPAEFDTLAPADQFLVNGFRTRTVQEGIGGPLVAHRKATSERRENNPFLAPAGMSLPVTATLEFQSAGRVLLAFHDVLVEDDVHLAGKNRVLAADFTAPLGKLMNQAPNLDIAIKAVLKPENYTDLMGLYFMEPLREGQIPIVLSHGLMSHPATWKDTYNELVADRALRENYQFWFFLYPSGLPVARSGAGLRKRLDEVRSRHPGFARTKAFNETVLIGHSMGGLVTDLQIREGGDALWARFFDEPIDELNITDKQREVFREAIYFRPQPNVSRVIFCSVPHRGSPLAQRPIVTYISKLVTAPVALLTLQRPQLLEATTELGSALLDQPLNGLSALRASHSPLEPLLDMPLSERVTFHSIIGDRGKKGPLEESSDGIVPYSSSHLAGAASEKIVPSGHGSHAHPEGVAEIRRILLEHLRH